MIYKTTKRNNLDKKIAYIAGPYRSNTIYKTLENVRAAEKVAIKYIKEGYLVYCPHMATRLFDGIMPDNFWLDYQLQWLRRCDVIIMMENYLQSDGARKELIWAEKNGLEIIFDS
jgi:hypothetical protein